MKRTRKSVTSEHADESKWRQKFGGLRRVSETERPRRETGAGRVCTLRVFLDTQGVPHIIVKDSLYFTALLSLERTTQPA